MKDCSGIKADWEKLASIATVFATPQSFAWHLAKDIVFNGVEITHDIQGSIEAFEKSPRDWKSFGYNIGNAAADVFLGEVSPNYVGDSKNNMYLY